MKSDKNDIFIIIDGFNKSITLQTLALDFAVSASDQLTPSKVIVEWINPPNWVNESHHKALPLDIRKCQIVGIQPTLQLVTFPMAIPRNFTLDALQLPFEIAGFVFSIDLSKGMPWQDFNTRSSPPPLSPTGDGIEWAKESGLPSVVVVTSIESPLISIDEIASIYDIPPNILFIPYTKKNNDSRFHFSLRYEQPFTYSVLIKLVELIQSNTSSL